MRLDRLQLWLYGKFTDFTIDFGKHQADAPDLHIVYGPNEAGKTTLMSAYLDFLFGFPPTTPYNFKHPNTALKVGGIVTADKHSHEFARLKKNKNNFIDANEQPTDDGFLLQQLAGLSRRSYKSMFSLNDDTLVKGGESILASEGDLGKLLYSATTGVAQLSDALFNLRAESDLFYKKGKRSFELAELKAKLKQIDSERKSINIEASTYSKLAKERDDANATYEELGSKHDKLKLQIEKLRLKKSAYPRFLSLNRLEAAISPLKNLPDTPNNWVIEVEQLKNDSIKTETIELDFIKNIDSISKSINLIVLDDAALNASHLWQQIDQDRDNYVVATNNLPDAKQQLRQCELQIEAHLHKLGQTDVNNPRSLVLDSATQSEIKDLIKQHPDLLSLLIAAKKELASAQKQHKENQALFSQRSGNTDSSINPEEMEQTNTTLDELEASIAPFSNNDLVANLRTAMHKKNAVQQDLDKLTAALSPWKGDTSTLLSLNTPHASELQSLQRLRDDIRDRTNNETNLLRSLKLKLADLCSQQKSYTADGLVDDAESQRLRGQREAAWENHKQALDPSTADIFEHSMRADDAGQASRLLHTESLAKLSQLSRDIVTTDGLIGNCQKNTKLLSQEQDEFELQVKQVLNRLSPLLSPSMSIEAISAWIETHTSATRALHQMNSFEQELDDIDSQASKACKSILINLTHCNGWEDNITTSNHHVDKLSDLLSSANILLKRHRGLAGLWDQLKSSQYQLDTRTSELKDMQHAMDQWTLAWNNACKRCWLGSKNDLPTATIAEDFLQQLAPLESQLAQQTELNERISKHQKTITGYIQLLNSLSEHLSIASNNVLPDQLYQSLTTRMEKATATQTSLKAMQTQKNTLLEQQKTNQVKRAAIRASVAAKSAYFSVDSIEEIQSKIMRVTEKQELQKRIDNEQSELLDLLEVDSLSDATKAFSVFDSDEVQLELDKLDRIANDLDLELRKAYTAQKDAQRAIEDVGGDDAVALLSEQRANLLLNIEEKITRFLQLHIALNAADAALKVYRDNHRSSMITKASDAFAKISQGRYSRLDTFQEGASEQLIAIEKNGGSKVSSALSKGTRYQLYLALRIAGYHEYAGSRPSVPFIADDILETSDDERAHQTFEVLGEMASAGQVIYLTHHQHLCDIAKKAVPQCTVHRLA